MNLVRQNPGKLLGPEQMVEAGDGWGVLPRLVREALRVTRTVPL